MTWKTSLCVIYWIIRNFNRECIPIDVDPHVEKRKREKKKSKKKKGQNKAKKKGILFISRLTSDLVGRLFSQH